MATTAQEEFDELMRDKSRTTAHPEDRNQIEDDDIEAQRSNSLAQLTRPADPRPSMTSNRDKIPQMKYGANTGPKGVISDAQLFREQRRQHRTATKDLSPSPQPESTPSFGQQLGMERLALQEEHGNLDELDDDMDDEFLVRWRSQRIEELQTGRRDSPSSLGHRKHGNGSVATVDADGFLHAVEGSGSAVVVVYIYDDLVSWLIGLLLRLTLSSHKSASSSKTVYDHSLPST